ncbi:hypothetical protein BST86_13880 [Nonlabens agnitus]|uniref:Uncharacterized protein n=2 Tax=Nonlabens agnitus TaxID=870484 RepID=A0A2S9WX94_9FLAO|nr:hypothetical protein BST86_13880 [Nonlabens agnitus]
MAGTSCRSKKKVSEKLIEKTTVDKSSESISEKETVKSLAIEDQQTIPVPAADTGDPILDKKVNKEVDQILKKIKSRKTSGSNSSTVDYDEQKREININTTVGPTESKKQLEVKNDSLATTKNKLDQGTSETVRTVWPWWLWALLIGGSIVLLIRIYLKYGTPTNRIK